jgi:Uma2 family endonuclease
MLVPMPQSVLPLDEFLERYNEDERYELNAGILINLEPNQSHDETIAGLEQRLDLEIEQTQPPKLLRPYGCLIKTHIPNTAFRPDIMVLDRSALDRETQLWADVPIVSRGKSIKLIAEVVSPNWHNDYRRKLEDYATFGIAEYWIVDPAGFGSEQMIAVADQPIVMICTLAGDRYQQLVFQGDESIRSALFPNLNLTASQILTIQK